MLRWDGWEGMEPDLVTEQRLEAVLGGLARREPIFHRRELVNDRKSFERETAGDFWEVAASGQRLSREFVWAELKRRYENSERDQYETEHWETRDFHLREVAPATCLLTYTLSGNGGRLTRRLTVGRAPWRTAGRSFHQGTGAEAD